MRSVLVYGADLSPLARLVYQNQIGVTASVGNSVIRFLVSCRSRMCSASRLMYATLLQLLYESTR
jgi:hypothetical protein